MLDQLVREIDPFLLGYKGHQILLDFVGALFTGQPKSCRQPRNVRIDDDSRNAESIAQYYICSFSSYSRQFDQCLEVRRHLAVKPVGQNLA